MIDPSMAKAGDTVRLIVDFYDGSGPKSGLTVTVRIKRTSDGYFLKNDGTWTASPSTEYTATELDATNFAGRYYFNFTMPNDAVGTRYDVRFDGSASATNRYEFQTIESIKLNIADLHKAKAALVNKQSQNIATSVVTIKDDDGTTNLLSLTPALDSLTVPTTRTLTPS